VGYGLSVQSSFLELVSFVGIVKCFSYLAIIGVVLGIDIIKMDLPGGFEDEEICTALPMCGFFKANLFFCSWRLSHSTLKPGWVQAGAHRQFHALEGHFILRGKYSYYRIMNNEIKLIGILLLFCPFTPQIMQIKGDKTSV
jgi:hypothetical protein